MQRLLLLLSLLYSVFLLCAWYLFKPTKLLHNGSSTMTYVGEGTISEVNYLFINLNPLYSGGAVSMGQENYIHLFLHL